MNSLVIRGTLLAIGLIAIVTSIGLSWKSTSASIAYSDCVTAVLKLQHKNTISEQQASEIRALLDAAEEQKANWAITETVVATTSAKHSYIGTQGFGKCIEDLKEKFNRINKV